MFSSFPRGLLPSHPHPPKSQPLDVTKSMAKGSSKGKLKRNNKGKRAFLLGNCSRAGLTTDTSIFTRGGRCLLSKWWPQVFLSTPAPRVRKRIQEWQQQKEMDVQETSHWQGRGFNLFVNHIKSSTPLHHGPIMFLTFTHNKHSPSWSGVRVFPFKL